MSDVLPENFCEAASEVNGGCMRPNSRFFSLLFAISVASGAPAHEGNTGGGRAIWTSALVKSPSFHSRCPAFSIGMLRLATSRRWQDNDGERQEETEWHDVEVWGKQAEAAGEHLAKGRQVYVEGRLKTDSWADKQSGQKRYRTKIVAEQVTFLGTKPAGSKADAEVSAPAAA